MAGIYLHIPFCKQACHYCDFHFSTSLKYKDDLIAAMLLEIDTSVGYLPTQHIDTIYFGGGTPSVLPIEDLARIMAKLSEYYTWSADAEVTLEANPDDLTAEYCQGLASLGINRLSIGIQSFYDIDLKAMNRAHDAAQARACVQLAQAAGIHRISIDLIYGAETTTDAMWADNVAQALDLGVGHVSAYCLTVEEGTALAAFVARGTAQPLDEEKAERQFAYLIAAMEGAGFMHYEISNFGKPSELAVHNTNYWMGSPYLGIGPSAHSYNGQHRRSNVANNAAYMWGAKAEQWDRLPDTLTSQDRYNEYVLTALRTMWGIDREVVRDRHGQFLNHFDREAAALLAEGLTVWQGSALVLTPQAKFVADGVSMRLFSC